jgi:hypothetical protein
MALKGWILSLQITLELLILPTQGQLCENLYLQARLEQEAHAESNTKEGIIREFVSKPIPKSWDKRTLNERRLYWATEYGNDNSETVERDRICAAEVWCECLGGDLKYMKRADALEINSILSSLSGGKGVEATFVLVVIVLKRAM